jgi:predicted Zn finger-like uncharacterized protein
MKFVCERCHTRYSIADDKVRQKILKIRCKTCENVITVRDPGSSAIEPAVSAPQPQPPPAPPAPARGVTPPPLAREWFVAVNGEQHGPVTRIEAAKRIHEAHGDDEIYVWKEGLDGWKPPSEVAVIQQEVNALRARTSPPPPRPAARPPAPSRGAAHGSHAAAAKPAPQASPFGEEDHTQIQPFDAAMLAPDVMARPASGTGAVLPFRGRNTNGVPAPAPAAASLDGLFSDLPPAGGAAAFVPAPASLRAPGRSDSGLSKLTGFAGFMSRNPGLKFVAAGAVVVVLLALAVIVLVRMPDAQKPPPPPVATEPKPEPPPLEILPGRAPEEKPSTKSVGQTANVSHGPSMGPAKGSRGKPLRGPQRASVTPPSGQGSLEPAPIADGTSPGPHTAAPGERVVPKYEPKSSPAPGAGSGAPKEGVINAVVNKHENKVAITTCYERALKRDTKLRSGKMNVSLTVKPSGIPGAINITAPPEFASVEACIKQAVRRWMFPASNEEYQIEFPLIMAGNQ